LKGQHEALYRLEHLITAEDVKRLRELAVAYGVSFPEFASNALLVGLREVEVLGIGDVPSPLSRFVQWVKERHGGGAPSPTLIGKLVQEMFILWDPATQKDFEKGVSRVVDPEEQDLRRKALSWWFEYCHAHRISPTLLVDQGARW